MMAPVLVYSLNNSVRWIRIRESFLGGDENLGSPIPHLAHSAARIQKHRLKIHIAQHQVLLSGQGTQEATQAWLKGSSFPLYVAVI